MKNEICDNCHKECEKVWLSSYAGLSGYPDDWYVCANCRTEEEPCRCTNCMTEYAEEINECEKCKTDAYLMKL